MSLIFRDSAPGPVLGPASGLAPNAAPRPAPDKKYLGKVGEAVASSYLRRRGYRILERNYRAKIGEIDIVAREGGALVFVEVRTKRSDAYGMPEESINIKKMRKLTRLAQLYMIRKGLCGSRARFDIVSVLMSGRYGRPTIKLIKNAFLEE